MDTNANQKARARIVTDEAQRAELLAAYEASGLTQKAFAARAGINYHTFISWLVQQRRTEGSGTRSASAETLGEPSDSRRLEVRLPGEIVVRGQNPSTIATLVHSLRNNLSS